LQKPDGHQRQGKGDHPPLPKITSVQQPRKLDEKGGKLFDVTMGAYDGAEISELVGCYILSIITD